MSVKLTSNFLVARVNSLIHSFAITSVPYPQPQDGPRYQHCSCIGLAQCVEVTPCDSCLICLILVLNH